MCSFSSLAMDLVFFKQLWYNNACFQKMCSGCVAWELDKAESSCFICSGRMCLRFIPFRFTNSLACATPIKNVRFFTGFAAFECLQVYANVPACSHWWFQWSWIESIMTNLHTGVCLWVAFSRLSAKCEFLLPFSHMELPVLESKHRLYIKDGNSPLQSSSLAKLKNNCNTNHTHKCKIKKVFDGVLSLIWSK